MARNKAVEYVQRAKFVEAARKAVADGPQTAIEAEMLTTSPSADPKGQHHPRMRHGAAH